MRIVKITLDGREAAVKVELEEFYEEREYDDGTVELAASARLVWVGPDTPLSDEEEDKISDADMDRIYQALDESIQTGAGLTLREKSLVDEARREADRLTAF